MRGNENVIALAKREPPCCFDDKIFASGDFVFAEKNVEPVLRIRSRGNVAADERRKTREQIELRDGNVGHARRDFSAPTHDERHASAAFEKTVFPAAKRSRGIVFFRFCKRRRFVRVAVVEHGTVVARENDNRVFFDAEFFEQIEKFADLRVGFEHGIAARTESGFSDEFCMRRARHMRLMQRIIKEKRAGTVRRNKRMRFARKNARHFLVNPTRLRAAFHESDARNAVDDGIRVPVIRRRVHFEQFGIVAPRRFAGKIFAIVHANRIVRIEPDNFSVGKIHARHAVICRRHNVGAVEADFFRPGSDGRVPIFFGAAEPEMPFADGGGRIAAVAKHRRNRRFVRGNDERRISGQNIHAIPPRVNSGEKRVAARRARGGRRVAATKTQSVFRDAVKIRRAQRRTVSGNVAVAEVVRNEHDDVRTFCGNGVSLSLRRNGNGERRCSGKNKQCAGTRGFSFHNGARFCAGEKASAN